MSHPDWFIGFWLVKSLGMKQITGPALVTAHIGKNVTWNPWIVVWSEASLTFNANNDCHISQIGSFLQVKAKNKCLEPPPIVIYHES